MFARKFSLIRNSWCRRFSSLKGRSCPLNYRYRPEDIAKERSLFSTDGTVYVIGG